jgi:hypothetical protein
MEALLIETLEAFTCDGSCGLTLVERSAAYHGRRREHHQRRASKQYRALKQSRQMAEKYKLENPEKAAHYQKIAEKADRAIGRHIHWGYHHETTRQKLHR